MELRDVIKARRSIRKYTDKAVEPEKIAELIEAARLCQSGHNKQPWRFLVLEGERRHEAAQHEADDARAAAELGLLLELGALGALGGLAGLGPLAALGGLGRLAKPRAGAV